LTNAVTEAAYRCLEAKMKAKKANKKVEPGTYQTIINETAKVAKVH
jgi:hypothetical protein